MIIVPRRQLLIGLGATIIVQKMSWAKTIPVGLNTGTDPAATAWKNAVVANGGTVSANRLALVSTFISSLKTADVWPKLDRLWLTAAENTTGQAQALTDLVALELATVSGSVTFTADRGYSSGGGHLTSPAYLFSTGPNFVRNSAHMGVYYNVTTGGASGASMGSGDGNTTEGFYANYPGNNFYARISQNDSAPFARSGNPGDFVGSVTAASLTAAYEDGVSIGTDATATGAPPASPLTLLSGDSSTDTNGRYAIFHLGAGLTSGQVTAFYNAKLTLLSAIGAQ